MKKNPKVCLQIFLLAFAIRALLGPWNMVVVDYTNPAAIVNFLVYMLLTWWLIERYKGVISAWNISWPMMLGALIVEIPIRIIEFAGSNLNTFLSVIFIIVAVMTAWVTSLIKQPLLRILLALLIFAGCLIVAANCVG